MESKEKTSMIAAGIAGSLSLSAFLMYNWKTFMGDSHPNISSWSVWSLLTILNFTSYKKLTNWTKSILPTANAVMTLATLGFAISFGSLNHLSNVDGACFAIGLLAGFMWWYKKSATYAQVLLQVAIVIGFIPTFIATYQTPSAEPYDVWLLWTFAFIAQFVAVRSTWEKKKYIEFLYPTLMIVCHGAVFWLVIR